MQNKQTLNLSRRERRVWGSTFGMVVVQVQGSLTLLSTLTNKTFYNIIIKQSLGILHNNNKTKFRFFNIPEFN